MFACIAKDFDHGVRRAIDDFGLIGEVRRGIDECVQFDNAGDLVEIADGGFELCNKVERAKTGGFLAGFNIIVGTCLLYTSPSPRD